MKKIFNFIIGFLVGLTIIIPVFADSSKKEFSQNFIVKTQQTPLKVQKNVNTRIVSEVERLAYEREYKTFGKRIVSTPDIPQNILQSLRLHTEINPFRLKLERKENKKRYMSFSEYLALKNELQNPFYQRF